MKVYPPVWILGELQYGVDQKLVHRTELDYAIQPVVK